MTLAAAFGVASLENFRDLGMSDTRKLEGIDPHWSELTADKTEIAKASSYSVRFCFEKLYVADSATAVASNVWSYQGSWAHYYKVGGEIVTHVNSASYAGECKCLEGKKAKAANLPGCYHFTTVSEPTLEDLDKSESGKFKILHRWSL
jgi:hypothetical protein